MPELKYPEWDHNNRAYSKTCTVKVNPFNKRAPRRLKQFEEEFGTLSHILSRSLGRFKSKSKVLERRTKHSGRLNTRYVQDEIIRLNAGKDLTQRIYDRRINPKLDKLKRGVSTGLLLDQSGSTRFKTPDDYTRIELIKYASLMLGRSLSNLDDEFFVYSFHTHEDSNPTIMEELKTEVEGWDHTIEERIVALEHTASTDYYNNKDGAAIRFANERISQSPYRRKYLFLVTDGNPNCDYTYYKGRTALEDTRKSMEEGNEKGIQYIYLTINPEDDADELIDSISHTTIFCKRFSRMKDVVEGLTLVYESLREKKF